jgi:nicotinamidase-related amidase
MSSKKICLLIIDPQIDFCHRFGSLFVPGADKDMSRLGGLIRQAASKISTIYISIDSHDVESIFHPCWFINSEEQNPDPFSVITSKDLDKGVWQPYFTDVSEHTYNYIKTLEKNGLKHTIWPYHCLRDPNLVYDGMSLVHQISEPVHYFDRGNFGDVRYIIKGTNGLTEQFSIFEAEVPIDDDPSTQFNKKLLDDLETYDLILVSGEAGSHCVASSLLDMYDNFSNKDSAKKVVLITDTISPVPGFVNVQRETIKELKKQGMRGKHSNSILKYINSIW